MKDLSRAVNNNDCRGKKKQLWLATLIKADPGFISVSDVLSTKTDQLFCQVGTLLTTLVWGAAAWTVRREYDTLAAIYELVRSLWTGAQGNRSSTRLDIWNTSKTRVNRAHSSNRIIFVYSCKLSKSIQGLSLVIIFFRIFSFSFFLRRLSGRALTAGTTGTWPYLR